MKKISLAVILIFNIYTALPQNLISNGGFENDSANWNTLWTRDNTPGNAVVTTDKAHTGNASLHLKYQASLDWSYNYADDIAVNEGEVYEATAWANVVQNKSYTSFSFVLKDANYNVAEWVWGACIFAQTKTPWKKYTSQFIIPKGVKYIQPRLTGWGDSCDFYADDLSIKKTKTNNISGTFRLQSDSIKVAIALPDYMIKITNRQSGKVYATEVSYNFITAAVDTSQKGKIICTGTYLPSNINTTISFSIIENALRITLDADSSELAAAIAFPGKIKSSQDDNLIIPRATGLITPVNTQPFFGSYFSCWSWKSTMPFMGVTNLKTGYMIVSDDPWDTYFITEQPQGSNYYAPQLYHEPAKKKLAYKRTFYYVTTNNGYTGLCQWYRRHKINRNEFFSFDDKQQLNSNIKKLKGAADFWLLDNYNFNEKFIDTLHELGVDKAIINIDGSWYSPSDKSKLISRINKYHLLSSRYDIYTDVWPPTHLENPSFRTEGYPDDVAVNEDGSLMKGWLAYINDTIPFQGYVVSSATHVSYAEKHLPQELATQHYNCRFVDVEMAAGLYEDFSPDHLLLRKDDAANRNALLNTVKNKYQLVTGVEEAHDFSFKNADYGEGTMTMQPEDNSGYDWSTPVQHPSSIYLQNNINPQQRIPLHALIYGDAYMPTWYTGDGMSKVPKVWDDKDLINILYGSMPLIMPPNINYWHNNSERYLTSYHLVTGVTRNTGFQQMQQHTFLTANKNVQQSTYKNGWTVVVNFDSSINYTYKGKVLPPKGFYAGNGTQEVFRKIMKSNIIAISSLSTRLFINPYSKTQTYKGVRSKGSVLLDKKDDSILLSFEGSQGTVDIQPQQLPWPVNNIKVFVRNTNDEVALTPLANGWYRLAKKNGALFYTIKSGVQMGIAHKIIPLKDSVAARLYPNPATGLLHIQSANGIAFFEMVDVHGSRVLQGTFSNSIDVKSLKPGAYFVKLYSKKKSLLENLAFVKE